MRRKKKREHNAPRKIIKNGEGRGQLSVDIEDGGKGLFHN